MDVASFVEELDSEKTVVVFRMLPKELATDVFACLGVGAIVGVILVIYFQLACRLLNLA